MKEDYITLNYDFSNARNSRYSRKMFTLIGKAGVGCRCLPTTTQIEPDITIDIPNDTGSIYHGSQLESPELLGNLERDLKIVKLLLEDKIKVM